MKRNERDGTPAEDCVSACGTGHCAHGHATDHAAVPARQTPEEGQTEPNMTIKHDHI
ncbi:MAG: hypothetical protein ACFFFG_18365 [Candidatus Thorarchaeota archaeon]